MVSLHIWQVNHGVILALGEALLPAWQDCRHTLQRSCPLRHVPGTPF